MIIRNVAIGIAPAWPGLWLLMPVAVWIEGFPVKSSQVEFVDLGMEKRRSLVAGRRSLKTEQDRWVERETCLFLALEADGKEGFRHFRRPARAMCVYIYIYIYTFSLSLFLSLAGSLSLCVHHIYICSNNFIYRYMYIHAYVYIYIYEERHIDTSIPT